MTPRPVIAGYLLSLALLALSIGLADTLVGPPRVKPDIARGEALFEQRCASCHRQGSTPDFSRDAWKAESTPEWLASVALGRAAEHPPAVSTPDEAWHVAAYVWTRPLHLSELRLGLELARQAEARLLERDLFTLLAALPKLDDLRSTAWVLRRSEREVDARLSDLAGASYEELSEAERQALVDYIYASLFTWPLEWEAEVTHP